MVTKTAQELGSHPRVSVIVPVFNEEAYLPQCIDSLLAQSLANIEVICVDDGSTDATPTILADYARTDARLKVISQSNAGPAKARNRAIEVAQGDYLYCCDADDFCKPNLLEGAVQVAERYDADVVLLPFMLYDNKIATPISVPWSLPRHLFPEGCFTWHDNPDATFSTFRTVPWNKLVRTSFIRDNAIRFQDNVFLSEDVMFSLPAAVLAQRVACTDEPALYHRENIGTSAMDTKDAHPLDFVRAFQALRAFLKEQGCMCELRHSYLVWVAGGCVYNLLTLKNRDSFDEVFSYLNSCGLHDLDISEADLDEIDNVDDANVLRAIFANNRDRLLHAEQLRLRVAFDQACYRERVQFEARVALEDRLREQETATREAQAAVEELQASLAALRDEHERTMNAAEQKIGRAVCRIPRAVQRKLLSMKRREQ